ncbi:hypothetical protein ACKVMW_21250 [Vibrio chagasii]|uniref:hypothetical protein n=1 Tax=Vibrio chagasii TaxID=170679 RepID=UPI003DA07204
MLDSYERDLAFLELSLTSLPSKSAIRFTFKDMIIPPLKEAVKQGTAVYHLKNDTASLHVHKVEVDTTNNIATILLHYTDSNLSDPAFKNMTSGVVRVEGKTPGEGIAVSAHLLVDLDNFKGQRSSVYLAILEEVPGLTKSLVEKGMTALFNGLIARPNWVKKRDGKPSLKVRPKFSLNELAAESLKEGLKSRRLTGIKLIEKSSKDNFDESDLVPKERMIGFSIGKNLSEEAKENLIYRVSKKAQEQGYSVLKVTYENAYSGSKTGTFKSLDKEVLERAKGIFSKKEKIYLEEKIVQCQESIHSNLRTKSTIHLCKEGGKEYAVSNNPETVEASLVPEY